MITIFSFRNLLLIIIAPAQTKIKAKEEDRIRLTEQTFKELIWLKDIIEWYLLIKLIWSLLEVLEIMHNKRPDKPRRDSDRVSKSCSTWTRRECWRSWIINQLQVTSVSSWTPIINRSSKKKWMERCYKITTTQLLISMRQASWILVVVDQAFTISISWTTCTTRRSRWAKIVFQDCKTR